MRVRSRSIRRVTSRLSKREEAVLLLILGLFFGTLFAVGMPYWQGAVTREEALPVTAVYQDCDPSYNRRDLRDIMLHFTDRDYLLVDSAIATEALLGELRSIPAGTACELLVHPNSQSTVLSLIAGGREIIPFDGAVKAIAGEAQGFRWMGLVCYVLAVYGLWSLVKRR